MTDSATQPLRILLAEDNEMNRELTVRMLKRRGFDIFAVDDGQALLDRLEREAFDVVLLDIQMPQVDGFTAARRIRDRENGSGRRIPIVALTAFSYDSDRERCFEAGMDAYVSKPIDWTTLVDTINSIAGATPPTPPQKPKPVDASALEALLESDPALWQDLHELFERSCRTQLEKCRTAIGNSDVEMLEAAAHTLKGSLGVVGAREASTLASNILDHARRGTLHGVEPMVDELGSLVSHYHDALRDLRPPTDG